MRTPGTRRTRLARGAAAAVALAALASCSWFYRVTGRVTAEDGATAIDCSLTVYDGGFLEDTCIVEGTAGPDRKTVIPLGGRFECHPSGNLDAVFELRIRCPGYAPRDRPLPVTSCSGAFLSGCDDIELGTLELTPSP